MRRGLFVSLVCAACLAAQDATFKASISMVEVDAQVLGPRGAIEGLGASDFAIQDERRPVALRYWALEETPLDIVLLFELSSSMAANPGPLRAAAEMAMAELREGDRVAVVSFEDEARIEQPLTGDLKEAKRRLRMGLAYARFRLRPAILSAARHCAQYLAEQPEPHGRRVVLLFTGDTGFGLDSPGAVTRRLWQADTLLGAMVLPTALTRLASDEDPFLTFALARMGFNFGDRAEEVARETGGEVVYAGDAGPVRKAADPNSALRQMIRRMRRRYRLYYDMPPGKPGQRRRIEVDLSPAARVLHPDARIIGRKGYVIPKHAPG